MSGKRVWWYFVAFFGFIAAVNAVMVTLALKTHSGMVTDHPYEKGLSYNKVIEAQEEQEKLGWNSTISYQNGMLSFNLLDKNNQPLAWEKATAIITRPTKTGLDFTVELKDKKTPINFPEKGLWEIRIETIADNKNYQQTMRVVVQ